MEGRIFIDENRRFGSRKYVRGNANDRTIKAPILK